MFVGKLDSLKAIDQIKRMSKLFRMLTILIVFLQEAESNRLCRRLQLKDIIPVEMQRVTKYPLLLDNIAKYTGINKHDRRPFCSREIDIFCCVFIGQTLLFIFSQRMVRREKR